MKLRKTISSHDDPATLSVQEDLRTLIKTIQEDSELSAFIPPGDVYAELAKHLVHLEDFEKTYKVLEEMVKFGLFFNDYVDKELVFLVCKRVGMPDFPKECFASETATTAVDEAGDEPEMYETF